jgi:hypothetical protein
MSALPLAFGLSALIYLHVLRPLAHLPDEKDPTMQMQGWAEFTQAVETRRKSIGAGWIATTSYATTAQLAFREPPAIPVLQLTERLRYAAQSQLCVAPSAPCVSLQGTKALYVELSRRAEPDFLRKRFRVVEALPPLVRASDGQPISTYALYSLSEPIAAVLDPVE